MWNARDATIDSVLATDCSKVFGHKHRIYYGCRSVQDFRLLKKRLLG